MDTKDKIILVTGATGHQGGAVVRHLLKDGWKVRGLTRDPEKPEAKELKAMGVEVVQGDLDIPLSLEKPLEGCYGVFSVQQPWEHGPQDEINEGIILINAAQKAGVKHFVYTSVGSADKTTGIPHFESKAIIEDVLKKSGLEYTIFRPVYFMENLLNFRDSIYNGTLSLALRLEVPLQLIAVDDIGKFVALAFRKPEDWKGKAMDIAGDELTGPEMARTLENAIGRDVSYEVMPLEELRNASSDAAMMFDWFNLRGYSADISKAREIIPDLKTFSDWAQETGWHRAAA